MAHLPHPPPRSFSTLLQVIGKTRRAAVYLTEGNLMQEDINELIRVNKEINEHEILGKVDELAKLTASELAFRRRGGAVVGRKDFLDNPNPGERTIQIESVQVYGKRAVVTCRGNRPGELPHNIRLFVKGDDGKWGVLGGANEPA